MYFFVFCLINHNERITSLPLCMSVRLLRRKGKEKEVGFASRDNLCFPSSILIYLEGSNLSHCVSYEEVYFHSI